MMENCRSGQAAIGVVNGLGPMVATGLRDHPGFEAPGARRTKEDTDAVREPGNLRLFQWPCAALRYHLSVRRG
jgi:hypothetical protein